MLHILLLILKIIGIILGVLLGIVLFGIVAVLFVPVRYSVEASRTEGEGNPPVEVKAKISWLLHFVNIKIYYPSEIWLKARILFITVFRLPQKKTTSKENRDTKTKKATKAGKNDKKGRTDRKKEAEEEPAKDKVNMAKAEPAADAEVPKTKAETAKIPDVAQAEGELPADETAETALEPENSEEGKKKRRRPKIAIKELWEKICKFFQNIWYTITGICDRIKTIRENIEYYIDILQSDTFKHSFELCKGELRSVFSYIKPRKFQAGFVIGLDDPASTAKILSYYGILYPFVGNHVNIVPDFDKKRMEGTVFIKGKIRAFTFIKAAVRIYFNKDIKRLIKLFMKEDV